MMRIRMKDGCHLSYQGMDLGPGTVVVVPDELGCELVRKGNAAPMRGIWRETLILEDREKAVLHED